ncbi:TonB-dependent receptor plug domain-containing protein [Sphingomonas sp. MMS24-JH45]
MPCPRWPKAHRPRTHQAPAAQAAETEAGADIVVTGSRIRRPNYEAPNPIVSLDAAQIQQSGQTNATAFLQRVPALTNSVDSTRSAGNAQGDGAIGQAGLNLLDLRGLGTNRTLVLVNGRRHIAGQFDTAAVDIELDPDRPDPARRRAHRRGLRGLWRGRRVGGGQFHPAARLRRRRRARAGGHLGTGRRGQPLASIIAGRNFADGRANLTLAYEYNADRCRTTTARSCVRKSAYFLIITIITSRGSPARTPSFRSPTIATQAPTSTTVPCNRAIRSRTSSRSATASSAATASRTPSAPMS